VAAGGSICLGEQASWPMPDDSPGAHVAPTYAENGNGTVSDAVTGLLWKQAPQTGGCTGPDAGSASCTQAQAVAYCSGLNLGGQTGWRLPTKVELESLISTQQEASASLYISHAAFPVFPTNAEYWTISPFEQNLGAGWTVQFNNAQSDWESVTGYNGNVLCVLGTGMTVDTAPTQYTINPGAIGGDAAPGDTVTDNRTGLVWQRGYGAPRTQGAAQTYCASLGGSFRLPTYKELDTLVDPDFYNPAVNPQGPFGAMGGGPGTPYDNDFWSSSPVEPANGAYWGMTFQYGQLSGNAGGGSSYYVRCVE
jgi:hypothetical protein